MSTDYRDLGAKRPNRTARRFREDAGVDVNVSLEWYGFTSLLSRVVQLAPDPEVTAAVKSGKI